MKKFTSHKKNCIQLNRFLPAALLTGLLVFTSTLPAAALPIDENTAQRPMRGIWVASVLNIDYPKNATTNLPYS
jgi:hypothetical protein